MISMKTPKRPRPSIRKDFVLASELRIYNFKYACEDCSHFGTTEEWCSLGYNSKNHRRAEQIRSYELSGKMALCHFMEID